MQKILRTLMLAAVMLLTFASYAQSTVTIGELSTATDDTYLPMNSLYDYSYSQQIYTAAEIGTAGTITTITVWLKGNANLYTMPFDIYMLEVPNEEFANSSSWIPVSSGDMVYSGSITVHNTTDSAYTFELDEPFVYSGAENLLICFDNNTGQWKSGLNGKVFSTDNLQRAIYARRDATDYDPTNMAGVPGTAITASRNVISLEIIPSGDQICEKPSNLESSNVTAHEATLTWVSTVGSYQLEYKTTSDSVWTEIQLYDTTYTLTDLLQNTPYNARVKAICGVDFESGYKNINFTTQISCPAPTGLSFTLTPGDGTTATINWNEVGTAEAWQICLNNDEENLIDVYDNTYTFTDLTPETAYTVKVRAYCDVIDQSSWSGSVTFIPTNAYQVTLNDGTSTNSYVPVYGLWVDNLTKSQFIIPASELASMQFGAINKLTFYASQSSVTWGAAAFNVFLTETTETGVSSLVDYSSMTQVYTGSLSINNNKMEVFFNTPYTYMGGNLMIGFQQSISGTYVSCSWYGVQASGASMGGYGSSISQQNFLPKTTIDFTPGEEPDCLPVTGLTVTNITSSTVTLNWNGNADSYSIYNMADSSLIMSNISDTTYTITDLNPNTNYLFGVQANCASSDALTIFISALTTCAPEELPYQEDFSASLANDPCWSGASGTTAAEVFAGAALTTTDNTIWTYTSTDRDGIPGGHYYVNIYGTTCKRWMITPEIDLTNASSPLLSFDAAFTKYSATAPAEGDMTDDLFMVIISTDGGQTWDPLNATQISLPAIIGTSYLPQYVDLSNYIGDTIKIAFYAESTVSGGDNDLHIDNITVAENTGTICYPVSNLTVDNVTANSVFLTWSDESNSGATYTIYNMADTSVIASNVAFTEYEVTGLDAFTGYTFGVVANCSADNESYMMIVSATTDCEGGSCLITIVGEDSYGDGWNGNTINILQNDVVIGTFTLPSSSSEFSSTFSVCSGMPVTFSWVSGSYTNETSFEIYDGGHALVHYVIDGSTLASGAVFFTMEDPCPSCIAPIITVGDVTDNSAIISWTSTADSYDIYNGTTFVTNTSDTTFTFTGLSAASNYTFGVQAICSATDSSIIATVSVSTECGTVTTFPYIQDFNAAPACWTNIDADGDGQSWILYQGAIQSASYNSVALTPDNWLISPEFAIPATGSYEVTWSATAQDQSWPAEHYGVFVSTTEDPSTSDFTMLQEWTLATGIFNPVIDLSAYAGQNIHIALRHWNCTDQFRISIDEFMVREQAGANQVVINVGQNNPGYGSVTGTGIYNIGDNVTVSATANAGYTFSKWVDENYIELSTDNPYTFVAATDLTLNAIFLDATGATYTITVDVNDSTMGTATGGGTYTAGEQVTLSATAFPGYIFVNWTQISGFGTNVVGTEPDLTITVTSDKTFVANFEADSVPPTSYLVTLNTANATMGSVSPAGANTVNAGSSFTATATANAGYHFVAWMSGNTQVSTANPYTFTVNENITLTATFEADPTPQYTVTLVTADAAMGSVSPAGATTVDEGTTFTATATANPDHHFVAWMNGNTQVSTANPYTFTVTSDITLTATFAYNDGIEDLDLSKVNVYSTNSTIVVRGAENQDLAVYDMNGRCIYKLVNANEIEEITVVSAGVYLVRVSNGITKKVVVLK